MKKLITILMTVIMLISSITVPVSADDGIKVLLNGKELSFDVPPQIIGSRTMVPMRTIFEALGYDVTWIEDRQMITAYSEDTDIAIGMKIGYNWITACSGTDLVNAESPGDYAMENVYIIDVPPRIVDGRTLVPVRAISEASGLDVQWDDKTRTVVISSSEYPVSYADISANINQIKAFIGDGLYLEAIQKCDQTKEWNALSPTDISLLDSLKTDAQNRYDEYVAEQKKWKDYYYDDWCIGFVSLASYKPVHYEGGDYIKVYNSNGSKILITSYKIGTIGSNGKLTANIKECTEMFSTMVFPRERDSVEIISETETTAGNLNAYQRTYRTTKYTNRYQTKADYQIIRHIVFEYGDWIYLIEAEQNKYIWDDDFYKLMDKVRTSIAFY